MARCSCGRCGKCAVSRHGPASARVAARHFNPFNNLRRCDERRPGMKTHTMFLRLAAFAMALAIAPSAFAQAWPTKPVRLVAAFPPGTPGDVIARLVQPALQATWNQP